MLSPVICSSCPPRLPKGKQDEGDYSHAENDNRNRGHFDDG
jgi:hypothetical protein